MPQFQVSFDDQNPRDKAFAKLVRAYLENPNISIPQQGVQSPISGNKSMYGYDTSNKVLLEQIQDRDRTIEEQVKRLEAQAKEIEQLKASVSQKESFLNAKIEDYKSLEALCTDIDKDLKEKSAELSRCMSEAEASKDSYLQEIASYKDRIRELTKKLEGYEGIYSDDQVEMYFNVAGSELIQTNKKDAPYKGKTQPGGKILFQFNCEKGKVNEVIPRKSTDLEPFCEILEEMEGGNFIRLGKWGSGVLRWGNTITEINEKAQIYIVKQ